MASTALVKFRTAGKNSVSGFRLNKDSVNSLSLLQSNFKSGAYSSSAESCLRSKKGIKNIFLCSSTQAESDTSISCKTSEDSCTVKVCFKLYRKCAFGQTFCICGDHEAFGSWDSEKAFPLEWTQGDVWIGELELPDDLVIEFKYLLRGKRGEVVWQPGRNRVLKTASAVHGIVKLRKPWYEGEPVPDEDEDEDESEWSDGTVNGAENVHSSDTANEDDNGSINGFTLESIAIEIEERQEASDPSSDKELEIMEIGTTTEAAKVPQEESMENSREAEGTEPEREELKSAVEDEYSVEQDGEVGVKERPSLNVLERDLKWGRSVWAGLVRSWGRVPLMDEEEKKN